LNSVEEGLTSAESNLLALRRDPVGDRIGPNGISEPHHTRDGDETVLAEPAVSTSSVRASASVCRHVRAVRADDAAEKRVLRTVVWCTSVDVTIHIVAGENSWSSVGVGQGEDGGGDVGVRWRSDVQRVAVLLVRR
jgi:hypothetical protein